MHFRVLTPSPSGQLSGRRKMVAIFDPSVRRKAPSTGLNSSILKATRGSALVAHGLRTNRARREAKFHASMLSVERTALRSFLRGPRGPSQTPFGRRPSSAICFPSESTRIVTCGVPRTASITASSPWNRRMALTATTYGWSSAPYRDAFFSRASRISSYAFCLLGWEMPDTNRSPGALPIMPRPRTKCNAHAVLFEKEGRDIKGVVVTRKARDPLA